MRLLAAILLLAPLCHAQTTTRTGQVELIWKDNSDNEDGFRLERNRIGGSDGWQVLATVGPGVETYTDATGIVGVTYEWRVWAFNGKGDSKGAAESNPHTVKDGSVPNDPLEMKARDPIKANSANGLTNQ